jgi:hypothetical protein
MTRRPEAPTPSGLPLDGEALPIALDLPAPEPQVMTLATPAPAQPLPRPHAPTPMDLLTIAMNQGADLDRLERLMTMQERWDEREAFKSYNLAFAAFKSESVQIIKNIKVTDGPLKGKAYADLFAAVDAATPALSKHGLSAAWKITKDEANWLEVTCTLRHVDGHSESVSMGGVPDTGGAKNAVQARASTMSYLERYTFLAITGLAAREQDNDGNGNMPPDMPEDVFQGHLKNIREAKTMEQLQAFANAAYKAAKSDKPTQQAIIKAKDRRKEELRGGAL